MKIAMNKNPILISFHFGILCALLSCFSVAQQSQTTVADIDGNVYHTVKIGKQVWLVENLKTTRYQNGDSITLVTDPDYWGKLRQGAYCNYDNDDNNYSIYGRIYNFYAVDDARNICPEGWEVPSYSLWKKLVKNLGGFIEALPKLKMMNEKGGFQNGNNESGFSGLPAGKRFVNGEYADKGNDGYFWSTTEKNGSINIFHLFGDLNEAKAQARDQYGRLVYYRGKPLYEIVWESVVTTKNFGISVRCVKID